MRTRRHLHWSVPSVRGQELLVVSSLSRSLLRIAGFLLLGNLSGFLDTLAELIVNGVLASAVGMDKDVQKRLKPDGLVVFNVHVYDDTKETLATIREAFPQVYVFQVSQSESLVVVGSLARIVAASARRCEAANSPSA